MLKYGGKEEGRRKVKRKEERNEGREGRIWKGRKGEEDGGK